MGGDFIANEHGEILIEVKLPGGGSKTMFANGYDPGEEVYIELVEGRRR